GRRPARHSEAHIIPTPGKPGSRPKDSCYICQAGGTRPAASRSAVGITLTLLCFYISWSDSVPTWDSAGRLKSPRRPPIRNRLDAERIGMYWCPTANQYIVLGENSMTLVLSLVAALALGACAQMTGPQPASTETLVTETATIESINQTTREVRLR